MPVLVKAHVKKYKSIDDSTPVDISDRVTVLVGKNESGKTGFLEALNKANSLRKAKFSFVSDFPRKDFVAFRAKHESKNYHDVVVLTFRIESELADAINASVFNHKVVVKPNSLFTRTTNYSGATAVDLTIDVPTALAALYAPLENIEDAKAAFDGANSLEEVIERIDNLKLPVDNSLAKFAAAWKKRNVDRWPLLTGHVWQTHLASALPKFLYFDDYSLLQGKINLPTLQQRMNDKQLDDSDETTIGLLELAGTSLAELVSEEGYETSKAKLEAIGLSITGKIFEFWKQNQDLDVEFDLKADPKDVAPFNAGLNLYIRIKNRRHGVTVPFDQRSKGFIWFFSFLVWFDAVQSRASTQDSLVLLLDEPGLNLHALAQADFLSYIKRLSEEHQIIYSTHSPFMVDSARLEDVRVVEDRLKEGTKVTGQLEGSSDESLFPLQAALGYSIAQNLFIAKKNVLVEGPADLIILQHLSALLESVGKSSLGDAVLVPVGGLDKLATFVALLGSNQLHIVVLHDKAGGPHQRLDDLVRQKIIERKRVLDFTMFLDPMPKEADLEDLLPSNLYLEAFNSVYSKELAGNALNATALGPHPRIVERINLWLSANNIKLLKDGGFNHYRVAQAVIPKLTPSLLEGSHFNGFVQLFERISGAL